MIFSPFFLLLSKKLNPTEEKTPNQTPTEEKTPNQTPNQQPTKRLRYLI
jgi:hypothetical protein